MDESPANLQMKTKVGAFSLGVSAQGELNGHKVAYFGPISWSYDDRCKAMIQLFLTSPAAGECHE